LLELLVAIALMALISGSLYASLYIGFKAHRSATKAVEPARTAALALELLRQDFDAALPPTGLLAGAFTGTVGAGANDSVLLEFFSCAHSPKEGETACDIRKVDLSVETPAGETQPVLMRRITTNLLASGDAVVHEQVLCRRVRSLTLRYYDGTVWQDFWDSAGQGDILPLAVEATLEFALEAEQAAGAERGYSLVQVYRIPCGRAATAEQ
jgi:type II secretory pathway component PulJ